MDGSTAHRSKSTREVIRRARNLAAERSERPAPGRVCRQLQFDFFGPASRPGFRSRATYLTRVRADSASSSQRLAQQRKRGFIDFECGRSALLQRWQAARGEQIGRRWCDRRAYRIERRAVVNVTAVSTFERFLKHVGGEAQARAVVSISTRMAYAILASGGEEEHRCRMADESAAPDMLDEHTAMRHYDVMIRGGLWSAAARLVRATANARDLDQLGGKEPFVVERRRGLDVLFAQTGKHRRSLDRQGYGVNPELGR